MLIESAYFTRHAPPLCRLPIMGVTSPEEDLFQATDFIVKNNIFSQLAG